MINMVQMNKLKRVSDAVADLVRLAESDILREWLEPYSPSNPCGSSLEYDAEYSVLQARLVPKVDVQYGDFLAQSAPPDWVEIDRDCRRLMLRCKDISVLIWFTRSRVCLAGAEGLLQGLSALKTLLLKYPVDIHPQLEIEGMQDPEVRANALAALCDPEGLMADIRDVVVSSNTAFRLSVRDVERAFSVPRPVNAMDQEVVKRQLQDLESRNDNVLKTLWACAVCVQDIASWAKENLGDQAPALQPLLRLLCALISVDASNQVPEPQAVETESSVLELQEPVASLPEPEAIELPDDTVLQRQESSPVNRTVMTAVEQREQVRRLLGQAREWIEQNEPSSPVVILLKQAERMWGRRFSEVAGMIPADLLQAWDQD
ncbi:ImpA family type VI secretion system protein [Uliginosibacterium gangwonense]|uniref:type VI secretion system protein TssA n=1 Tax=Uliginosibacterium gangwonense TaxID=392736 RepID=UPI00035C7B43|nr:type VI secretion system ImpA family N-terminal domain-containing protein [Uliginosibacterium gangwonense]